MCDRQAADETAIVVTDGRAVTRRVRFGELRDASNRLANALRGLGVQEGDRVAIVLPQRAEAAVAHIAVYKLGAVAVPLSTLFGPEALRVRLRDSGAVAVIGETEPLERVRELGLELTAVDADRDLERLLADASPRFEPAPTAPDTPAIIIYTSGTTGPDRKSTRLNSSHIQKSRMPSSA